MYIASANLGSFDIHHYGDLTASSFTNAAHPANNFPCPSMISMGHVDTADVYTCVNEAFECCLVLCGWPYGEDDFGLTIWIFHEMSKRYW